MTYKSNITDILCAVTGHAAVLFLVSENEWDGNRITFDQALQMTYVIGYVQDERYIAIEHIYVRRDCVNFAQRAIEINDTPEKKPQCKIMTSQ